MGKLRSLDELIDHLLENSIVDENTGCLLWQGAQASGYGVVSWEGKQISLHRFAYKVEHPDEVLGIIMHTCDVRNCWNLKHLINGTYQTNKTDSVMKDRHAKGSLVGTSVLSEEAARHIKYSPMLRSYLAKQFGVTYRCIWAIQTGRQWSHL